MSLFKAKCYDGKCTHAYDWCEKCKSMSMGTEKCILCGAKP